MERRLRRRLLVLIFAVGFVGGPSLALALEACASCCCAEMEEGPAPSDCELARVSTSCCDVVPATLPPLTESLVEVSASELFSPDATLSDQARLMVCATSRRLAWPSFEIAHAVSALRFKVVLQI